MRKSRILFILILFYSIFLFVIPNFEVLDFLHPSNSGLIVVAHITVFFILICIGLYFQLEEQSLSSKEISFIAVYSAFTAIARVPFIALPNIQPCSYLIFCAGLVFGPLIGFMIGLNTTVLSNFIAGHGPWTIYQIIAWGLIGIIGGLIHIFVENMEKRMKSNNFRFIISIIGFFLGLVYGLIMNIWSWLILEPPLTIEKFIIVYIGSFPFDIAHAFSNFVFIWLFGPQTIHILVRYKNRFFNTIEIEIVNESSPEFQLSM